MTIPPAGLGPGCRVWLGLGEGLCWCWEGATAPCPRRLWSPGLPHAAFGTSKAQHKPQAPSQLQPAAPSRTGSAGKHLALHTERGQGSQCLVCMPRAEHRLAMKHAARRIQQCLWKRGSPDAQTTEMLVCSFRDLQLILSSRVCKSYE